MNPCGDEIQEKRIPYPVILSDYNPEWPKIYSAEKELIAGELGTGIIERISHIGSTSIVGMAAKPTIDILLEVNDNFEKDELIAKMAGLGYRYDSKPQNPAPHMMFKKGYRSSDLHGQTYHIHVRFKSDWDELYFKEYISMHPEAAKEYITLKRRLKEKYELDRAAYTDGKTEFIMKVVKKARKELE